MAPPDAGFLSPLLVVVLPIGAQNSGPVLVTDSDTLRIGPGRIRLHGIDAPESKQTRRVGGETWVSGVARICAVAVSRWIGAEPDRCLEAARVSDPNQQRETDLRHRLLRVHKSIERLVDAYQEELITIDELRDRTPELRRQEQALHRELQSAGDSAKVRETYLRLAETLTGFLARLRSCAEALDIPARQRIVRLLVKEVLVSEDTITIRHSIPISGSPSGGPGPSKPDADTGPPSKGWSSWTPR